MASAISPIDSVNSVNNQTDSTVASSPILSAIKSAALKTGVDFAYLVKKAVQESGLDATAKASTSSATGLYQFTSQTWLQMVKDHGAQYGLGDYATQITANSSGHLSVADPVARHAILALRNDPQVSAEMAGELDKQNASILKQNVGGKIGGTELYLAHFLGAGGASEFLSTMRSDPNATAADVLPEAAAANQSIFYTKTGAPRSVAQIYQHFASKFNDTGTTATQVASAASHAAYATVASAASTASTAATSTAASLSNNFANFYSAPNASNVIANNAANAATAASTSGMSSSTTLFNTMLFGQLQDSAMTSANAGYTALNAANAAAHHRYNTAMG